MAFSLAVVFADDFVGCRAQNKGAYLVYVTADLRDDSRKSAAKTTRSPLLPRAKQSYNCKVLVTKWTQAPTLKRKS
ncbi:hypothetical protein, partial [Helicobacter canis]|uniref:hypothetical protein n=1 Tax=Helicobacter canis TaxID=29419 RepID=UPI0026EC0783